MARKRKNRSAPGRPSRPSKSRTARQSRRRGSKPNYGAIAVIATGVILVVMAALASRDSANAWITPAEGDTFVQGKAVYDESCALCHGENGQGDIGALLNGDPDSHSWHHVDRQLISMVTDGIPGTEMPPHGGHLSDEEIRAVIAYIKTWWSKDQLAMQRTGQHPMSP